MSWLKKNIRKGYNFLFGGDEGRKEYQRKRREVLTGLAGEKLRDIHPLIEFVSDGLSELVRRLQTEAEDKTGIPVGELLAARIEDLNERYHDVMYEMEERLGIDLNLDDEIGDPTD